MFNPSILDILLFLFAYLLGSISTSIIACRAFGLPDPRTVGSKNAGATNVLRIGGKKVARIVLIGDIFKGILPVLIASFMGFNLFGMAIVGLFAILGHIFPVFFNFKGGKGVATFIGVLLILNLYSGLAFLAIWLFIAKVLKISSISALVATLFISPIFYFLTSDANASLVIAIISIIIFTTHRTNIKRIINKKES